MKKPLLLLLFFSLSSRLFSQPAAIVGTVWDMNTGDVEYNVQSTQRTFTSVITDQADAGTKMFQLDYASLLALGADRSGGIIADVSPGSSAQLNVYAYDPTNGGQKGPLVYQMSSTATTTDFGGTPGPITANVLGQSTTIGSDQVLAIGGSSAAYANDFGAGTCSGFGDNWLQAAIANNTGTAFFQTLPTCMVGKNFTGVQPVIVELVLSGTVTVHQLKLPGIGELLPSAVFNPNFIANELEVQNASVDVGSGQSGTLYSFSCDLLNPAANAAVTLNQLQVLVNDQNNPSGPVATIQFGNSFPDTLQPAQTDNFVNTDQELQAFSGDATVYSAFVQYVYQIDPATNTYARAKVPASFTRILGPGQQDVYTIANTSYQGLPVFTLSGGMSAEYGVEKTLAALAGGVSHTWAVRNINGQPDLAGGGPVSVYSTLDFLDKSVQQTVDLYNTTLGATTPFNTVVIGAGVPCVSYMAYDMKAPFLPIQFLAAESSVAEVKMMVDHAISQGYKAYATVGYDPSIPEDGVAWIKLLDLPPAYQQFLLDHNVQNVIFIGMDQNGFAEGVAAKVIDKETASLPDYSNGTLYLMRHGTIDQYTSRFSDFTSFATGPDQQIADWESGLPDTVVSNFSKSVLNALPNSQVRLIKSAESIQFYNLATLFALQSWKKNNFPSSSISTVAVNEYLIGYPGLENWNGQLPFLYWQDPGLLTTTTNRLTTGFLQPRASSYYSNINYQNLNYTINAKYDRTIFKNAFTNAGLTNVSMNSWQKADVWDPSDGMNSPCEVWANYVINGGYLSAYQASVSNQQALDLSDLDAMVSNSSEIKDKAATHPAPSAVTPLYSVDNYTVTQYDFAANPYWQKTEYGQDVEYMSVSQTGPVHIGWLDGMGGKVGVNRSQRVFTTDFDLTSTSDEFNLQVAYKFNPQPSDGFNSYLAANGTEQNMDCFEYTKVPRNSWMDIPSRVMEREGAIWVVNGSVYDFDYNGIPGVVPFIKKDGVIKAQPQILSFKGEGCFAWNWGVNKSAIVIPRPTDIPGTGLASSLSTLYQNETAAYPNALAGMTYMGPSGQYDITALQPQWMINYPPFPAAYTGVSGSQIRCILSDPNAGQCAPWFSQYQMAPESEGWNNCSYLPYDENVQRYSALAYRQYANTFDYLPNSRNFVAMKGNTLTVGIVDGDLGTSSGLGYAYTKQSGMMNWELNNFSRYMGYDKLINLDGGSSAQIWYNGRGPLHDWTGYPLVSDNQGPYFSRLVSSFLTLVPKLHTDQIGSFRPTNSLALVMDNSDMTFDYSDAADHTKNKAFLSLGPSLPLLDNADDPDNGLVLGHFLVGNPTVAEGAILYSIGEDMYYPDTQGLSPVRATLRNVFLVGAGKIPKYIADSLVNMPLWDQTGASQAAVTVALQSNNQSFYYIRTYDSKIVQFCVYHPNQYNELLDNNWHGFMVARKRTGAAQFSLYIDNVNVTSLDNTQMTYYSYQGDMRLDSTVIPATHAAIGMVDVDGRFVTGNATLVVDNYLFAVGQSAMSNGTRVDVLALNLAQQNLPPTTFTNYDMNGLYGLQFEETAGMHAFSISSTGKVGLYGLKLNTTSQDPYSVSFGAIAKKADSGANVAIVDSAAASQVALYPNPTQGVLNVSLPLTTGNNVDLEIDDELGRTLIREEKALSQGVNSLSIDLSSIKANGDYVLKITSKDGKVRITKVFALLRGME